MPLMFAYAKSRFSHDAAQIRVNLQYIFSYSEVLIAAYILEYVFVLL